MPCTAWADQKWSTIPRSYLEKWESIHNGLIVSRNDKGLIVIESSEMGVAHVKFEINDEQRDELVEILAQA